MQSKYCYKGTDVLLNKLGIKNEETLNKAESDITAIRQIELEVNPIRGSFDLSHLKKIHKFIFSDIYNFSGELREENISKGFVFANAKYIQSESEKLFKELRSEKFLMNKNLEDFSERAAYYMSEINVLHPFREGNGRTNREFIRELAAKCGYKLNWDRIPKDKLFEASVRSVVDIKPLADLISNAIENKEPIKDLSKMFEKCIDIER